MFAKIELLQIQAIGLLTGILLLTGCTTIQVQMGRNVDPTALEHKLTIGESTQEDVRSVMGEPDGMGRYTSPVTYENGTLWTYYYEEATMQEAKRIFVYVYFKEDRYTGYIWFSSLNDDVKK